MTTKASEKELAEVHNGLAKWCIQIMNGVPLLDREGSAVLKEDGTPWIVPPSPAHLNVIRQFLKDNKIEADSSTNNSLQTLEGLPVFDEDDTVVPIRKSS